MNIVALICARGGSKGLPGKNIKMLVGKPLITLAINQAKKIKDINQIIVSTDSEEIANIARTAGADVPFIRPYKLAQDDTPEWQVWRHALTFIRETDGAYPDIIVVIPVTAPLRSIEDIEKCIEKYKEGGADIVVTATDAHRSPYFNMIKENKDGSVDLVIPPKSSVTRRQDAPTVYDMTTVAYVTCPEFVMNKNGIFEGRVCYVHIPVERALDIDTPLDFKIAECLLATSEK